MPSSRRRLMTDAERRQITTKAVAAYRKGKSIREISETTGRSYGSVHRILSDAGVSFRSRGGSNSSSKT